MFELIESKCHIYKCQN